MGTIIIVSDSHRHPTSLLYNLGNHSLVITGDYGAPDAFELGAPVTDETTSLDEAHQPETIILGHDETYNLYQCLHTLLFVPQRDESAVEQ
jgi:hypothetical protein